MEESEVDFVVIPRSHIESAAAAAAASAAVAAAATRKRSAAAVETPSDIEEGHAPKKKARKSRSSTPRSRLEKKMKSRPVRADGTDHPATGLILAPTKRGPKTKTLSEKHLKSASTKKKGKSKRSKVHVDTDTTFQEDGDGDGGDKGSGDDDDVGDADEVQDADEPPSPVTPPPMDADGGGGGDESLSSESERRKARSRQEKKKTMKKTGNGDLRKSVSLCLREETVEDARRRYEKSAVAAKQRQTDSLVVKLVNSMKQGGDDSASHPVCIETFSKLLMEHPEAAAPTPAAVPPLLPPSVPPVIVSKEAAAAAAAAAEEATIDRTAADAPLPDVPFTHPLIQAFSNTSLSVPALERYGESLTPAQLGEQLDQKRLASPLLKTHDISALFVECGSVKTASGRVLTFPGCIQGVRCQGKVACIEGLVDLPLKERPLLMGFIYEHEMTAYLECRAELPTDRKCVLCMGVDFGSTLLAIRGYSYKIHVEQMALLQTYRVPVDAPGGYHRGCTYTPEPKEFRFDPFPRVDTSFYYARRDPSVMLMTGPDKQRARWVIDDTSTHYQPETSAATAVAVVSSSSHSKSSSPPDDDGRPSRYLVYSEISIVQPEKQKTAKAREEKRLNSKENTSGKHRSRQSEREKTIKDNHTYSEASTRLLSVRCGSTRHASRVLELLPSFTEKSEEMGWLAHLGDLLVSKDMQTAHYAAWKTKCLLPRQKFVSVVPTLCVAILRASGAKRDSDDDDKDNTPGVPLPEITLGMRYKCDFGKCDYTPDVIESLMLRHLCPGNRQGIHHSLFVQVVRLTVLSLLLDLVHDCIASQGQKPDTSLYRAYNVIVYHLQCMVDSLWHVPYYICDSAIEFERSRRDPQSVHESLVDSSSLAVYLRRACVHDMNATNQTVACDRTIPYVSEFDHVYTKTHEKGKTIPAFHLFWKAVLTRNNRRKFPTVVWNYAELDAWFKDLVVRIIMSGLLGNYLCLTRRRPEHRMPMQARFVLYKMYSSIAGSRQGDEFYQWIFLGMQHLALYMTHLHSVNRIVHNPALEIHCKGIFDFVQYRRAVENAVSYASEQFLEHVLSKQEVVSIHCLSKTPISGMSAIASSLDAQMKKECENMFLRLVHSKMIHGFLGSLKDYMHYHPTIVWDHPRTSLRLHPFLESLVGAASLCVLGYALVPGCKVTDTTGIDTCGGGDGDDGDGDGDIEATRAPEPALPIHVPTTCTKDRLEVLLQTRVPVQYQHLAIMRKAVRTLHPLDRYPERHLFKIMPVIGCSKNAVHLVQNAMTFHELDDKSAKKNAIKTLRRDYPFSYSVLQVYAELWRVHESVCTFPLPRHYFEAQVKAVQERFHVPPGRPLPDLATHALFCNCCDCITTIVREEEVMKRLNPNAVGSAPVIAEQALRHFAQPYASSRAQCIALNKRVWDHGTVQTYTKLPRTIDGVPTVHCVDEKIYLGEKCGQRPLARILLLGKMLVFKGHMITLCVGRGCGRPCVIAPKICEYGQMGYMCSVCSQVRRRTGLDPTVTLVTPRVPLPDIPKESATTPPREYYHTNARREIAEKKEMLKKKSAAVTTCDACGADTTHPRIMTITQDAGRCARDGSDNGQPVLTVSATIVLSVCGKHYHEAPKYDMKRKYIEKKTNPECVKAGKCTCSTADSTCTGLWTRESAVKLMNSLDRTLPEVIESRSVKKTLRQFKRRQASASQPRKKSQPRKRKTRNVRR